jgi:tRNA-2-methylthio-N6-dimethylallyladenosine synthase
VTPEHHEGNSGFMEQGFKEITLLGQNVDSYLWYGGGLKKDFTTASEIQQRL